MIHKNNQKWWFLHHNAKITILCWFCITIFIYFCPWLCGTRILLTDPAFVLAGRTQRWSKQHLYILSAPHSCFSFPYCRIFWGFVFEIVNIKKKFGRFCGWLFKCISFNKPLIEKWNKLTIKKASPVQVVIFIAPIKAYFFLLWSCLFFFRW